MASKILEVNANCTVGSIIVDASGAKLDDSLTFKTNPTLTAPYSAGELSDETKAKFNIPSNKSHKKLYITLSVIAIIIISGIFGGLWLS